MRAWRDIARELVNQTDLERIQELTHELSRAVEEQGIDDDTPMIWPKPLPPKPN